ncbi:hypothetical protein [Streptomyces sp. NPDC001508]|uniref:hypothetical protein n=1 Tax=Streptomyces sp. NPDC001508 TaxID=3154656 RepID=UPI00332B5A08
MHPVARSSTRLGLRELTIEEVDMVLAVYGSPEATEHLSFEPRARDRVAHLEEVESGRVTRRLRAVTGLLRDVDAAGARDAADRLTENADLGGAA